VTVAVVSRNVGRVPRRRGMWTLAGVAAGVVTAAGLLAAGVVGRDAPVVSRGEASTSSSVAEYRDEIAPILERGASLVALGMRPGTADISDASYSDEVLVSMASSWVATAERVKADFGQVAPPPAVAAAHDLYLRALDEYLRTAETLLAAARAPAGDRRALIERAAELGGSADRLYDRADAAFERVTARRPSPSSSE
jgi:hypothetical protein